MTLAASGVLRYCRPGFEGETAQELIEQAAAAGLYGHVRAERGSGWAEFVLAESHEAAGLAARLPWREAVFAWQSLIVIARSEPLVGDDRLTPLLARLPGDATWCDAWVEAPDSESGRALAPFCRAFGNALVQALKRRRCLAPGAPWRLHLFFADREHCLIAAVPVAASAPWPGGIPRLKFPREAPSRSTLKLDEAFQVLLDADERERWLRPGLAAVDLGASPGGWTWQLVRRSIRVTAVDNGPMDAALMASGLVTHRREDGFHFQPAKPVDWLVCDMVEQPRRVAARIAEWLAEGWCRQTIFNLKLPMKKRHAEVRLCLDLIRERVAAASREVDLRARQLYHDREEVTVFARAVRPA